MPVRRPSSRIGPDEYLDWEKSSDHKHEYSAGEVFAVSGASAVHVKIALNVASMLLSHLRGGPCETYMADMKVRVAATQSFYYPDVFVTCDERDLPNDFFKEYPVLIVEVLSPSTAAFDRGMKFAHYQNSPSLKEYVLIDTEGQRVDCFRRGEGVEWVLHPYLAGGEVRFESVDLLCSMDQVYEGVRLPSRAGGA